jgi:hypothetical protein
MDEGNGGGDSEPLSLDETFELLAHERRRRVITCLREHGTLTLADLADEIAEREHDAPISKIPKEDVLHVYSSLWHTHVPKLAEAGVVEYDQDRDLVSLGDSVDQVAQFVSLGRAERERTDGE